MRELQGVSYNPLVPTSVPTGAGKRPAAAARAAGGAAGGLLVGCWRAWRRCGDAGVGVQCGVQRQEERKWDRIGQERGEDGTLIRTREGEGRMG